MTILYLRDRDKIIKVEKFGDSIDDFLLACQKGEAWQNQDKGNHTFKVRFADELGLYRPSPPPYLSV